MAEQWAQGRIALVTGATSGFGEAMTRRLLAAGAKVIATGRRTERLEKLATELATDRLLTRELDVTSEASIAALLPGLPAEFEAIDILYNNAGLALGRYPFWESNPEDEERVLHTNVDGVMRMTRLTLPHIRDGGHILFMGSVAGRQAYPNAASYVTAKFGLRGFVYALREDLLGRPIRITTVDAGLVETEFSIVRFKGDVDKAKEVYRGIDPLTAEDIAECVVFAVTRPPHVNVDEIVVKALAQSSGGRILRNA